MTVLATLRQAQEAVINAALRCVLDPRQLVTLPAVWLRLEGLSGPTLERPWSVALVSVYVVVKPLDAERDLESLETVLETVAAVIPPMSDPRLVALALPGGGTPAPAFIYSHDLTIEE